MKNRTLILFLTLTVVCTVAGGSQAGWNPFKKGKEKKKEGENRDKVAETISYLKERDPSIVKFFENAYGYAIFPTVGKGGIGIGGAYGKGEVYEEGKLVGTTSLKQVTVGFQLGGQSYSEVIFFKTREKLDSFKGGNFEFGAQVSAVAVAAGVSRDAPYERGVAVFTLAKGGLMYEATVGGQKFGFDPIEAEKQNEKAAEIK